MYSSLCLHMDYLFRSYFLQILLNWWRHFQVSTDQRLQSTTIFKQMLGLNFCYGHTLASYDHITEDFMMRCMERVFVPLAPTPRQFALSMSSCPKFRGLLLVL